MQKIIPHLWFDHQAEAAANFYVSLFKNSKIMKVARYGEVAAKMSGRPAGSAMTVEFQLEGQPFLALNGGPMFQFSPAISFLVNCETQEEIDRLWDQLSAGGEAQPCGWLRDKYGVSWQVVPSILGELMTDTDPQRAGRVGQALMKMRKLDLNALKQAYEGK